MERFLVTGAGGFLGGHLVESLRARGCAVRALIRTQTDTARLHESVDVAVGDLRDRAFLESAVRDCTAIVHVAVRTSSRGASASEIHAVNVEATEALAKAALRASVERFVYASSTGVYGVLSNHAIDETTPVRPWSPYSASKAEAETRLLRLHRERGLPVVIARLSSLIGPGARNWLGLLRDIETKGFRMVGDARGYWQLGDSADISEGLYLCATVPGIEGQIYLLSGERALALRELVAMMAEETGGEIQKSKLPIAVIRVSKELNRFVRALGFPRLPRSDRMEFFLTDRAFDLSKARRELGYEPKVDLRESIRRTVAADRASRAVGSQDAIA